MKNKQVAQGQLIKWAKLVAGVLAVAAAATLLFVLAFRNTHSTTLAPDTKPKIHYVLVNGDKGTSFNGTNYNLGSDFVKLINQDSKNSWQVTSADVANAGFAKGNYDAMIVIGPDFSHNLLSLQSTAPQKAALAYRVRSNQNRMNSMQLKAEVASLLTSFNRRIVTMYFASMVNSIADAQSSVTGMVNTETTTTSALNQDIVAPLNQTPAQYKSLFNTTAGLVDQDKTWEQQQQDFTKASEALLASNSKQLDRSAITLNEYIKLQEQLAQINAANSQATLTKQSTADEAAYHDQFNQLNDTVLKELAKLWSPEDKTGLLKNLQDTATDFATKQAAAIKNLADQEQQLKDSQTGLENQRQAVLKQYTGDEGFDYDGASDAAVKTAVTKQLSSLYTNEDGTFPKGYFDEIDKTLKTVPVDGMADLIKTLTDKEMLSADRAAKLKAGLAVVNQYVSESGATTGKQDALTAVTSGDATGASSTTSAADPDGDASTGDAADQPTTSLAGMSVDVNHKGTLTFTATGLKPDLSAAAAALNEDLADKMTATVSGDKILLAPVQIKDSAGNMIDPPATTPAALKKLGDVAVTWTWDGAIADNAMVETRDYTAVYTATDGGTATASITGNVTAYLSDLPANKFQQVLAQLNTDLGNFDSAVDQIAAVYGPTTGDTDRVTALAAALSTATGDGSTAATGDGSSTGTGDGSSTGTGDGSSTGTGDGSSTSTGDGSSTGTGDSLTDPSGDGSSTSTGDGSSTATGDAKGKTLASVSPADSVYNQYLKLPSAARADLIEKTLTPQFVKDLADLMKANQDSQKQVKTMTDTVAAIKENLIDPETFNKQYQGLADWLTSAQEEIAAQNASWKKNPELTIQNVTWQGTDNKQDLYHDDTKGPALLSDFQAFTTKTASDGSGIGQSAAAITPLSTTIAAVVSQAKQVQAATEGSLKKAADVAKQATTQTQKHQTYSKNFNKVFKNAEPGSANRNAVFDFLASPLALQNQQSADKTATVKKTDTVMPYLLTVITALVTLFGALGLNWASKTFTGLQKHRVLKQNLAAKNLRATGIVTLGSALIAAVYTVAVDLAVIPLSTGWWVGLPLLMFGMVMLMTYLVRQLRTWGIGLWGVVFSLYLILTPVIGVTVNANSWVGMLYRLSPYQWLQGRFTLLLSHLGLGIAGWAIVGVAALLTVGLNLVVWHKEAKEDEQALPQTESDPD